MAIHPTEAIIDDIRQGRMVIVMDDEDRENEGDLIMAASVARAEDINFMARYGRGLICLDPDQGTLRATATAAHGDATPITGRPPTSRSRSRRRAGSRPASRPRIGR